MDKHNFNSSEEFRIGDTVYLYHLNGEIVSMPWGWVKKGVVILLNKDIHDGTIVVVRWSTDNKNCTLFYENKNDEFYISKINNQSYNGELIVGKSYRYIVKSFSEEAQKCGLFIITKYRNKYIVDKIKNGKRQTNKRDGLLYEAYTEEELRVILGNTGKIND